MPDPSGARGYSTRDTPTRTTSSPTSYSSSTRGTGGSSNTQNTGPGAGLGSNQSSSSSYHTSSPSSSSANRGTGGNSSTQGMTTPNRNTTSTVGKGVNFSSGDYMNAGYGSYQQPPSRSGSGSGGSSTVRQGVNLSPADMLAGGYGSYQQPTSRIGGSSTVRQGVNLSMADLFSGGYGQYQQPPGAGRVGMKDTPLTSMYPEQQIGAMKAPSLDGMKTGTDNPFSQLMRDLQWATGNGPMTHPLANQAFPPSPPSNTTNVPQGVNYSPADYMNAGYGQYRTAPGQGTPERPIVGVSGGNPAGVQAYNGTRMPGLAHDLLSQFAKDQDRVPQFDLPQANRRAYETLMASLKQQPDQTGAPPVSPMAGQGALSPQVADAWSRQDSLPHVQGANISPAGDTAPQVTHPLYGGKVATAKTPTSPFKGLDPNSKAYKDLTAKIDRRNQFSPAVLGTSFLKNGLISGPILDALSRSFAASGGMYGDQGNGGGGGGQSPATGNTQLTANDLQNGGNGGHNPAAGNTQLTANDLQNGGNGGLNPVIPPDIARFLLQMFGSPQGPTTTPFRYSTNLAA